MAQYQKGYRPENELGRENTPSPSAYRVKSNSSGRLYLYHIQIAKFHGHKIDNTTSKEGFHVCPATSINLETKIDPLKVQSNLYGANESSRGGEGGLMGLNSVSRYSDNQW